MNLLLAMILGAMVLGPVGSAVQPVETLCGVHKPQDWQVQGPRLPGQVLHATWPPAGCDER